MLAIAFSKSLTFNARFSKNASHNAEITTCSISEPIKPSVILASVEISFASFGLTTAQTSASLRRLFRWTLKISLRSLSVGKSTKKISSKRPFLNSSGGSLSILLAVAMTKTGAVFSCIQVRNVPKILDETPLSLLEETPFKPFSISSTQRMAGATASTVAIALRIFSSELPTMPEKILPKSRRSSGSCQIVLIAFAVKLLPQPGTPVTRTPLGAGMQYFFARSDHELLRFKSHFFRLSSPPISSMPRSL